MSDRPDEPLSSPSPHSDDAWRPSPAEPTGERASGPSGADTSPTADLPAPPDGTRQEAPGESADQTVPPEQPGPAPEGADGSPEAVRPGGADRPWASGTHWTAAAGAPNQPGSAQPGPAQAGSPQGAPSQWTSPQAGQPSSGQQYGGPQWGSAYQQPVPPSSPFPRNASTLTRARPARRGPGWLALLIAMIVTALVAIGGTYSLVAAQDGGSATQTPGSETGTTSTTAQSVPQVTASGDSPDWEAVAQAVSPATVSITVQSSTAEGVGSGVIYDADGHIVTNYHVISTAAGSSGGTITVTLSDGRLYEASIVGYDETTDLAVIQLENPPSDLTVARFGSSADLVVGQNVMAIGSPLGLSNTATTGVISALDRPVEVATEDEPQQVDPNDPFGQLQGQQNQQASGSSVITNAIQVDASINPGNSGGPLFDASGSVIGINSSIASMASGSSSAGSIGLGFAIPSDLVASVTNQLISTGTVDHAVLGVTIQSGTATVDGTTTVGAEVVSVTGGGAADQAGIREGDVILSIDGNTVSSGKSLSGFVRRYTGGSEVQVELARDGATQDVTVTLQSADN